jgi:hypothetical protein
MKYDYISFKQFSDWCNKRAADGKWGMTNAIECSQLCSDMYKVFFLKREKVWKEKYEPHMRELVNEIERKIELDKMGKLREQIEAEKAHKEECYKITAESRYNQPGYRRTIHPNYFVDLPFIVKPEAAYSGKVLPNETYISDQHSKKLGDYMSTEYTKCSLHESLIYNDFLKKFVYSLDIYPTDLNICDTILVITASNIGEINGDKIDMYIRDLMDESFLEYDKDAIQKLINENANTIDRVKQEIKFLKQWLN